MPELPELPWTPEMPEAPETPATPPRRDPIRGRGADRNPPNRFTRIVHDPDPDLDPQDVPAPRTEFLRDSSRSVISRNDSPDVGFDGAAISGENPGYSGRSGRKR